ncbi:SDR family oxidoreductase [Gordonia sp. X0973]|uniref:SDR family NAD(P)-dependent oxidoreductase n=1 Tax=Gordonia sp. X0973 TaxID=2742602 RepID=UPI000F54BAAC|nr:SDR family oxidoreductase [Gordonia sp. X0973]QKT06502.1 SDR family oxidoreductase [Gordonia sp. X0973]
MGRFDGMVAVVNAAAGAGIGGETVRRLLDEGASVAFSDVSARRLEVFLDDLREHHPAERLLAVAGDAGDEEHVAALFADVAERFGRLDVLVNSVGLNRLAPFPDTPLDVWQGVLGASLTSHFLHARAAWPLLTESSVAAIVNVSSLAARRPSPFGEVSYAAAKGGVLGLTHALAYEGTAVGIRCNAVLPGLIWNERLTAGVDPEYVDSYRSKRMFDRDGEPGEVADVILFLASSDSRNVTGQEVTVGA